MLCRKGIAHGVVNIVVHIIAADRVRIAVLVEILEQMLAR